MRLFVSLFVLVVAGCASTIAPPYASSGKMQISLRDQYDDMCKQFFAGEYKPTNVKPLINQIAMARAVRVELLCSGRQSTVVGFVQDVRICVERSSCDELLFIFRAGTTEYLLGPLGRPTTRKSVAS